LLNKKGAEKRQPKGLKGKRPAAQTSTAQPRKSRSNAYSLSAMLVLTRAVKGEARRC